MEIEAFPFVYGTKSLYIIMGSVLWCSLWPYLLSSHVQGILHGLLGRKHIKTLGLNAHVFIPLKNALSCLDLSLDPGITGLKNTLTFSHKRNL